MKYFPILESKSTNYDALASVDPNSRANIIPVIQLSEPEIDFDSPSHPYRKTPIDHALAEAEKIIQTASLFERVYVELEHSSFDEAAANAFLRRTVSRNGNIIPLLSPGQEDAVKRVVVTACRSIGCIGARVSPGRTRMLTELRGSRIADKFLLADCGYMARNRRRLNRSGAELMIQQCLQTPHTTFCFAGGSIPAPVSYPENINEVFLSRDEYILWRSLNPANSHFGDYATEHPRHRRYDPRLTSVPPRITYAHGEEWFFIRFKQQPDQSYSKAQEFRRLCRSLTSRNFFRTLVSCQADQDYESWGNGSQTSPGTPGAWRKARLNRHITLLAHQTTL